MTQIIIAESCAVASSAGLMFVALVGYPRKKWLEELGDG